MTKAELAGVGRRNRCFGDLSSPPPIGRTRGSTPLRHQLWRFLPRSIDVQMAISEYVAQTAEQHCLVLPPGCRAALLDDKRGPPDGRQPSCARFAQRFEAEKQTLNAMAIWAASGLAEQGGNFTLRRKAATRWRCAANRSVWASTNPSAFLGFVDDVQLRNAGGDILFATADREPFGLSVVEAMATALPVVAARGGGQSRQLVPSRPISFTSPRTPRAEELCFDGWHSTKLDVNLWSRPPVEVQGSVHGRTACPDHSSTIYRRILIAEGKKSRIWRRVPKMSEWAPNSESRQEKSLLDIWVILRRRKYVVLVTFVVGDRRCGRESLYFRRLSTRALPRSSSWLRTRARDPVHRIRVAGSMRANWPQTFNSFRAAR